MKYVLTVLSVVLVAALVSCVSAKTREECKMTCLTADKTYQNPDALGCSCQDKVDEEQRNFKYND